MNKILYYIFLGFTILLVTLIMIDVKTIYAPAIEIVQILMWVSLLLHTIFESKAQEKKVGYYFVLLLIIIVLLLTVFNVARLHLFN